MRTRYGMTLMLLLGFLLLAEPAEAGILDALVSGNLNVANLFAIGMTVITLAMVIGVLVALLDLQMSMLKDEEKKWYAAHGIEAPTSKPVIEREGILKRIYQRLTQVVPVEQEKDILMDHSYDGIRELDNSLPPWWLYMFYASILFAVVYMGYYHFSGRGLSSTELYQKEMAEAEDRVRAYLASRSEVVDETNVTMLFDEEELAFGQTIFQANCAACHGTLGEGGVGPNLTDNYWLHGGSIKDVFRTIKYGVPEKGMIAWQQQLRPLDMHRVSSYIMTLVGTDPPNQKEPQGDLYEEGSPADSTATGGAVGMLGE